MTTAYNLNIKYTKSILSCRCTLAFVSFAALLIILLLSPKSAYPAQTTLVWSPVIHPDVAGYKIYYGTSSGDYDVSLDVGNWTSVTIAGLDGSKTYYFASTTYSTYGEESDFSNEVQWPSTTANNGGGGGGGCFIATAAYGSALARIFHELLSRDLEDGRACPPCEQGEAGGPPGNRPAAPRDWFPYLNSTPQGELVLPVPPVPPVPS
jgi:hypothetical protein